MKLDPYRHLLRYAAYLLLAAGVVIGLYYSHRYAYRWGAWTSGRPVTLAYIHEDEDADILHLYYNVLALRVYARYPDTGSASDHITACASAKMEIQMLERQVIPRLRREGHGEEADRLDERIREARELIAVVEKKPKGQVK
jgi:hypothetical protein